MSLLRPDVIKQHKPNQTKPNQFKLQRHAEWIVSLVTEYGHFNYPASSVCVGIYELTFSFYQFYHPRGYWQECLFQTN